MFLNKPYPYNSSFKTHVLIAVILGLLLGFILLVLKPLNLTIDRLDNYGKVLLMGFGLVKFVNYLLAHVIENYVYREIKKWTWWNEIIFLVFSTITGAILGYIYSDFVLNKQILSFRKLIIFFFYIVLPITPLLIFPKAVLRYLFSTNANKNIKATVSDAVRVQDKQENNILLEGQNSNDQLVLLEIQLIYVKSVDNYLLVYYEDNGIQNKMLRATLNEIAKQIPFLVQPHRSYLINPKHDFKIIGNSQKAVLTSSSFKGQIPIARSSYKNIKALVN